MAEDKTTAAQTTADNLIFTAIAAGGRGAWFSGSFIYWGAPVKRSLIGLRRLKARVNYIWAAFDWLVVFGGWLSLIAFLVANRAIFSAAPAKLLFFWTKPDPLVLAFLLSLWFDLYLFYKHSEKIAAQKKINYRLFSEAGRPVGRPDGKSVRGKKKYNVATAYGEPALKSLEEAYLLANRLRQTEVGIIHLFRTLLQAKEVQNLFVRLNVDAKRLVTTVDHYLAKPQDNDFSGQTKLAVPLEELLISAFADACSNRQDSVDVLNMIALVYEKDKLLAEILYDLEIDGDKIKNAVEWFRVNERLLNNYRAFKRLALLKPGSGMNRAYTAIATPTLDHFSRDLTVKAKYGGLDICVGRQAEINAIFEDFTGGHNGVLLVGPTGVGKTTIVEGLAQLMVAENVPPFLKDKRLVELDVAALVSGSDASQAEGRLLNCLNEIRRSGNIILYIDNLENLIGITAGAKESLDLSEVLSQSLGRKNLFCLASATTENYNRYIDGKALGDTMTTIGVKEPDKNSAIRILESKVGWLESKYDVYIVYSALEQAVVLSNRYIHDKFLPLKAVNLLEKAAQISAQTAKDDPQKCFCSGEEAAAAISALTGIPVSKVTASESAKLLNLETQIHERLIDQEEAVSAVSASLRRARAALKEADRPIASFLFMGPTGVGKTELAKAVSQVYFGDENYLVRLDMSEYQLPDSLKKMIGDVDGTLGYLTEAVRKKPFTLVLVDEVEKAHPDILNLFLQVLDDGRLTDGQGRTISFSESIIIATSNIGAVYIQEQIKLQTPLPHIKQELIDNQLNKYLRPELINRFDGIIVFKPLSEQDVFAVAALMLKKIKKNLAEKGIDLKADKAGVAVLAKEGYDPKFGARPLRRLLQDKIENIIANKILAGELKRRDTVIIDPQAKVQIDKAASL